MFVGYPVEKGCLALRSYLSITANQLKGNLNLANQFNAWNKAINHPNYEEIKPNQTQALHLKMPKKNSAH